MRRPPTIVPLSDAKSRTISSPSFSEDLAMAAADQRMGHRNISFATASHDGGQLQFNPAFDRFADDNKKFDIHGSFCPNLAKIPYFAKIISRSIDGFPALGIIITLSPGSGNRVFLQNHP